MNPAPRLKAVLKPPSRTGTGNLARKRHVMAYSTVVDRHHEATDLIGATDVLVYRRASGGRFVLTGHAPAGVTGELLVDDEPAVREALRSRVRRIACETRVAVCGGYTACSAAIVCVDRDVIVVLGRRDGCLAGVSDLILLGAAAAAAEAQSRGV